MFNFRRKKNKLGVSAETVKSVLPNTVTEEDLKKFPPTQIKACTGLTYEPPPYVPPTDKEIIEGLEWAEQFEAAGLIRHLKKQNMILKGKLTKLTKKANAYKEDLDKANVVIKELMKDAYGKTE